MGLREQEHRVALLAFALAGCNSIYGLEKTRLPDAPPPDAPAACGEDGSAPKFPINLRQVVRENCSTFMLGDSMTEPRKRYALGDCRDGGAAFIQMGPLEGPLEPVEVQMPPDPLQREQHRLVPEGDELWVIATQPPRTTVVVEAFRFDGARWIRDRSLPVPASSNSALGVPSRAPDRRIVMREGIDVVEYAADDGRELGRYKPLDDLGVNNVLDFVNISEDALRIVFVGAAGLGQARPYHAFRAHRDQRFGRARALAEIDGTQSPFLSNDCQHLYFVALNSVFEAQLQ